MISKDSHMRPRMLLLIIVGLFFISMCSAYTLPTQTLGEQMELVQSHPNATSINITKIAYPSGSDLETNYTVVEMYSPNGYNYYFNFTPEYNGHYVITTVGDGDGVTTSMDYDFLVTPNGEELELSQTIIFLIIVTILVCAMVFSIWGVNNAATGGWQIFYICASYILIFSVSFVLWLFCRNYLWQTPILESITWIVWLVLSILFWPFIIGVSAYILGKQAEALMVQDYIDQGFSAKDARELSKSKRKR